MLRSVNIKAFVVAFCCIFPFSGMMAQTGTIEIFSEEGDNFTLFINAKIVNDTPQTNVLYPGLKQGMHAFKIEFENPEKEAFIQSVFVNENKKAVYMIKKREISEFESDVRKFGKNIKKFLDGDSSKTEDEKIHFYLKLYTQTDIVKDTLNSDTIPSDSSAQETAVKVDRSFTSEGTDNDSSITATITIADNTPDNNTTEIKSTDHDSTATQTETKVLKTADQAVMTDIINDLKSETFEDDKLEAAKEYTENYIFTSAQLKQMIVLFDFENSKTELVKAAYPNLSDPENIEIVFDTYEFESSKDELRDWLKQQ